MITTAPRTGTVSAFGQLLIGALLLGLAVWFWHLQGSPWPTMTRSRPAQWTALLGIIAFTAISAPALYSRRHKNVVSEHNLAGALWHVFHASQTGFALELAARTVSLLRGAGHAAALYPLNAFDGERFAESRCLFLVSTTGEGDPPDPALAFVQHAMRAPRALQGIEYGILALGDRSYAHYCAFGHALDRWLAASGAMPMFDLVEVDNAAAPALQRWQAHIAAQTHTEQHDAFARAPLQALALSERVHVNPGSAGGAAFELNLAPVQPGIEWQAGDIAEIRIGPADADADIYREYSIASLPVEGRLSLLVRMMHTPDGKPGLGSGWLCQQTTPGDDIQLRIRRNPNFHTPDGDVPLILIGNGTGIAGLRAHLRARIDAKRHRNWVLFGERTHAHDRFYDRDLATWLNEGAIAHLDRVYSRDADSPHRYVQDALAANADRLRQWMDDGAVIMVCGSREGMAPGVDQVLRDTLGDAAVDVLMADGRYRRDVY